MTPTVGSLIRSFLEKVGRSSDGRPNDGQGNRPPAAKGRVTGPPTSSNGASSFHLFWELAPVPLIEVAATIEVVEPPTVDKLYFWALQANFQFGNSARGGAHFGLQHHPAYTWAGAVNWGGYRHGGGELDGSTSELPSALDNVNTRNYQWQPHRRYRYRIYRSPRRGWRGSITDLETGEQTVVRDLLIEADTMINPMVWTEAFADCDDSPAAVRWSDFQALSTAGEPLTPVAVRVNYQSHPDGGCANTNIELDGSSIIQRTSTERTTRTGTRLPHPPPES